MPVLLLAMAFFLSCAAPAHAQWRVDNAERDGVISIDYDSPEMADAVTKAKASLGAFFGIAEHPPPGADTFSVKVGLPTPRGKEYIWARLLKREDGRVAARIDNTPRWTTRFHEGQTIRFNEAAIIDWLYVDGERMRGNFTSCAINKMVSAAEAEAMRRRFRMTCEE
jgi:uncharacterized protein YegJ (DUF2314 family)